MIRKVCAAFTSPTLEELPLELLPTFYNENQRGQGSAYHKEFTKRLLFLVRAACEEFLLRTKGNPGPTKEEIDHLAAHLNVKFINFFDAGDSDLVLVRFANHIRHELDNGAFDSIAHRFYRQLPIYHLKAEDRQILLTAYATGLARNEDQTCTDIIASQLQISPEKAKKAMKQANKRYRTKLKTDFSEDELNLMTEGNLTHD